MAYIVLTIIGLVSVLLVKKDWQARRQITFVCYIIMVGTLIYLLIDIFVFKNQQGISKGIEDILAEIPLREIGMYFFMLAGMTGKYLFDAIGEKKRQRLKLNKWQFIKPFLVSPIIFGTVYAQLPENTSTFMLFIFSFQNGFFWQTLLYRTVPEPEKGQRKNSTT